MFQELRQKEGNKKNKKEKGAKKKSRLLIEESGLSFGKAFILHPSPERTRTKSYFTIQLTHESYSSLVPGGVKEKKKLIDC